MPSQFEYDVFISYSSADRAWATQLHEDLEGLPSKVFFDRERLTAGDDWNEELHVALEASRHLVVLWSHKARESDWVLKELGRFDAIVNAPRQPVASDRRIIMVLLEGENRAYGRLQAIADLKQPPSLYPDGKPSGPRWLAVTREIADVVQVEEGTASIPVLLFTMTKAQVKEIPPSRSRLGGPTLQKLLDDLQIPGKDALGECYGDRRRDWRPFGSDNSIEVILDRLRNGLNKEIADAIGQSSATSAVRQLRWKYVDDEFWSSQDGAERATRRLAEGAAVLVVDPLSLYDQTVFDFYGSFGAELLSNGDAFVLVLSPYPTPKPSVALRDALNSLARQIYRQFYTPLAFRGVRYARCGPNVGDEDELGGWLASAVGPEFAQRGSGPEEWVDPKPR